MSHETYIDRLGIVDTDILTHQVRTIYTWHGNVFPASFTSDVTKTLADRLETAQSIRNAVEHILPEHSDERIGFALFSTLAPHIDGIFLAIVKEAESASSEFDWQKLAPEHTQALQTIISSLDPQADFFLRNPEYYHVLQTLVQISYHSTDEHILNSLTRNCILDSIKAYENGRQCPLIILDRWYTDFNQFSSYRAEPSIQYNVPFSESSRSYFTFLHKDIWDKLKTYYTHDQKVSRIIVADNIAGAGSEILSSTIAQALDEETYCVFPNIYEDVSASEKTHRLFRMETLSNEQLMFYKTLLLLTHEQGHLLAYPEIEMDLVEIVTDLTMVLVVLEQYPNDFRWKYSPSFAIAEIVAEYTDFDFDPAHIQSPIDVPYLLSATAIMNGFVDSGVIRFENEIPVIDERAIPQLIAKFQEYHLRINRPQPDQELITHWKEMNAHPPVRKLANLIHGYDQTT